MIFYLGAPEACWLGRAGVPLFVSRVRLVRVSTYALPRAKAPWALDSGGFSEIAKHGRWTVKPPAYVAEVYRYQDRIGSLRWAAIQDYMCEPDMLAKTGLTVAEHQRRTVASYFDLRDRAPDLPWAPVLQGWTLEDYLAHVQQYDEAGLPWSSVPVVGVGTMCRRQGTSDAVTILGALAGAVRERGAPGLHAFGFKVKGLELVMRAGVELASSDSMAWSQAARRRKLALDGCRHKTCQNCMRFALFWRQQLLEGIGLAA